MVTATKPGQTFDFESFRATVQDLSLSLFRNLAGPRMESVSEHVLFKDVLVLTFACIVRRFAETSATRGRRADGLNSLSLIKREARIIERLDELFDAKLTTALTDLNQSSLETSVPVEYIGMAFETLYGR